MGSTSLHEPISIQSRFQELTHPIYHNPILMNYFNSTSDLGLISPTLLGNWKNEFGSIMRIESIGYLGELTGSFRTNTGSPKPNEEFRLIGKLNGKMISFTVQFKGHNTITNWLGELFINSKQLLLDTQWSMLYPSSNLFTPNYRQEIMSGSNRFYKVA